MHMALYNAVLWGYAQLEVFFFRRVLIRQIVALQKETSTRKVRTHRKSMGTVLGHIHTSDLLQ